MLAQSAAFCAECGLRVSRPHEGLEPAQEQSPPRSRAWMGVLAGVLLAAIGAGAVLAMLTQAPVDPELAATGSPAAGTSDGGMPSAEPSPAPVSSTPATPTPEPTPTSNAILANRAIANVLVDQLNVRDAASPTAEVLGQLRAGSRVFVIGAPQSVDGMHWYRVAVVSGAYSADDCDWDLCIAGIGHVASPIHGDPWIEAVAIGCPASPMTATDLGLMLPLERLHCYADDDIVVTGTIDTPCCGHIGPVRHDPGWLASPGSVAFFRDVRASLLFRSDPATGLAPPSRGDVIRATGHFDDPTSADCRQTIDPEYADDEIVPGMVASVPEAVLVCRTQLVISGYEVIDHEDLGPCCGLREGPTGAEPHGVGPANRSRL